ncbi:hypothetical protein H0I29_01260 [Polaribacter sp. R2A056_3_33]|uniref:hypothetical protein n=1 Tax=Polaribacter sp. R2A056_3_33 TaxID=2745563 RepID=UPI001C4E58DE|nr:hypothetical protein [Polaribacter sp. R2A056_3_33]QXP70753.1 hypothetical protein H0I29_01260 [Polaribacter sp. R2A056_3_33]
MRIQKLYFLLLISVSLVCIECDKKVAKNKLKTDVKIEEKDTVKGLVDKENIDYEAIYDSLVEEYKPEVITEEEFNNFKKKSNYSNVIKAYDAKNSIAFFGGKKNEENIRYYPVATNINEQEYGNNTILFGDLNGDDKRDCIISVFRANNYEEVTFFYVFINKGTTFKLEDVTNETEICGCKSNSWPNSFRYQKIEDGFLKGLTVCHYNDAHCCPSIYLKTKVKFTEGKLQFDSAHFVMDDAVKYRPTPNLDSILFKKGDLRK